MTDDSNKINDSNEINQSQTTVVGVGALLRATRERIGDSVEEVAVKLRINRRYIRALEDGKVEDLPAVAYAIGFVRTYADHLGLDSDEIVRRFKEEIDGVRISTNLDFPAPVPESGIPSGAVLVAAVIVAMLAYGGWYLTANEDSVIVEGVEDVPSRLAEDTPAADGVGESAGEEEASDSVTEAVTESDAETVTEPVAAEAPVEAAVEQSVEPAAEAVAAVVEPVAVEAPTVEPVVEPVVQEAVTEVAAPIVEPVVEQAPEQAPEQVVEPVAAVVEAAVETAPVVAEPAEQAVAAPEPVTEPVVEAVVEPVVAAVKKPAAAKTGRVVLRAVSNSWIQITDSTSGKSVVTRMLRKGSEYTVEDRPNLQLSTGNAGALEVLVDGQIAPAIGKPGEVVRNFLLDADALKGGEQ